MMMMMMMMMISRKLTVVDQSQLVDNYIFFKTKPTY